MKKLLQILLDNIYLLNVGKYSGCLCHLASNLGKKNLISYEDISTIHSYIKDNKPEGSKNGYFWEKGDIYHREKWLKEQINKLT